MDIIIYFLEIQNVYDEMYMSQRKWHTSDAALRKQCDIIYQDDMY